MKARAWKEGLYPSDVKSASYTAAAATVATPAFNPDGGAHAGSSVSVTVSCETDGATIRYTTDGSEPDGSSAEVLSGETVLVSVPGTLKASIWQAGLETSAVKTADYEKSRVNDFDGDGKTDVAVYNNGYWSIYLMGTGTVLEAFFGGEDGIPVR